MVRAERTFAHPVAIAGGALAVLAGSAAVALQDPVPSWELSLTRWINDAPDLLASPLYPVMQLGVVLAPLALALVIVVVGRDRPAAVAVVVSAVVAWFGAKAVKQLVDRGRPLEYLPGIDVREGDGQGLGFISGHSAVAAATAVTLMAVLPRRARPVVVVLAVLVGVARIVYGVHLPADVVGGWAFGALVGLGAVELLDAWRARAADSDAAVAMEGS